MTSGSLIRADVFAKVGFYDEAMFIDYVDFEFCLRLQRGGFTIVNAPQVTLCHELGAVQTRTLLGWRISVRVHSAWRYYYIMRNRVVLLLRYGWAFRRWALRDASWIPLELGRMALLEDQRGAKLRCALRGLWDGLRGRTGRHPQFP
jgi:rhamnosyltransferase